MPVIVAIAGPSGAGKTVLSGMLKDEGYAEIVSVTTRAPRKGEQNGVHYSFVNEEQFKELQKNNGLIESINMNGNYYGVPAAEAIRVSQEGRPIVVVAEPHGISQINKYCEENGWKCYRVFVNSPMDLLMERLEDRLKNDLSNLNKNSDSYDTDRSKVIKSYESRKEHVLIKEQNEWVRPAYENPGLYDAVFNKFDKSVEAQVLDVIKLNVDSLLQEDNTVKKNHRMRMK